MELFLALEIKLFKSRARGPPLPGKGGGKPNSSGPGEEEKEKVARRYLLLEMYAIKCTGTLQTAMSD